MLRGCGRVFCGRVRGRGRTKSGGNGSARMLFGQNHPNLDGLGGFPGQLGSPEK